MSSILADFDKLPHSEDVKALVTWFVRAFDLQERGQYGANWGLTIPVKKGGDQVCINTGPIQAMYTEYFEDGWWCFVAVPKTDTIDKIVEDFGTKLAMGPGQTPLHVPKHSVVVGRMASVTAFLNDPSVFAECQEFLELFLKRKLPKPDRANDPAAEFVLGIPAVELRERLAAHRPIGVPFLYIDEPTFSDDVEPDLRKTLAKELQARGLVAVVPRPDDSDWHIGWSVGEAWVLVNTAVLTSSNEEEVLRRSLGTTLRQYQLELDRPPSLALLVNRLPADGSWVDLYADYGVSMLEISQLAEWLDAPA